MIFSKKSDGGDDWRKNQTQKSVDTEESGIHSLALDLEAARQEKKDLFDALG
jgi:hypothetical protein